MKLIPNKAPRWARTLVGAALCSLATAAIVAPATAAPVANGTYSVALFASGTSSYSQPDSIVRWRDSVLIGFENHVAKDGSDGKSSTIVQYSLKGDVLRTFSVLGHNDGMRLVGESALWVLQNEDANPNLVVIDLETGAQTPYTFPVTPHGGGYDDMVVVGDHVLMTASNPNLDANGVNIYPALVRASLKNGMVDVEPLLYGNASAVDIATGQKVTLNLTDPDSLTMDPRGNVVIDSQADSELVIVRDPLGKTPTVGRLGLSATTFPGITVDDTTFAPSGDAFLLVTDIAANAVYRIDAGPFRFEKGTAYTASDTAGLVGTLNLDTGEISPVVTGMGSARGLLFVTR